MVKRLTVPPTPQGVKISQNHEVKHHRVSVSLQGHRLSQNHVVKRLGLSLSLQGLRIRQNHVVERQGVCLSLQEDFGPASGQNEGVPDNLDSVFFDMRDNNLYFFKGEYVS